MGGLSVGETPEQMYAVLDTTVPLLPVDRPRYLMGVGTPTDLLKRSGRGIDLFDCVMPTRNGRNAMAFTDRGSLRLRNLALADDPRPLAPDCPCPACRHSRGYLRHLFMRARCWGRILLSIHNLTYYQRLLAEARQAIAVDEFEQFRERNWPAGVRGARVRLRLSAHFDRGASVARLAYGRQLLEPPPLSRSLSSDLEGCGSPGAANRCPGFVDSQCRVADNYLLSLNCNCASGPFLPETPKKTISQGFLPRAPSGGAGAKASPFIHHSRGSDASWSFNPV